MLYLYGFFMGCFIALTGAWKDTLFEEFQLVKFFRSPIITGVWYLILLHYFKGSSILLIVLSSAAMERVTVEGYKALIRQPPGKFQSPTKDRGWLRERMKSSKNTEKA